MAQLAQRLGLDLADALAGDREVLADFLERVLAAVGEAEAQAQHLLLARRERVEDLVGLLAQRLSPMIDSTGETTCLSSMKSPRWLSSSSPIGVSSEMGSWAIFRTLRTLSTGTSILVAISSGVGSRPSSWTSWREVRMSLLMVSIMCTGMRMVRAWSAMARVMAWRIHHVA